MSCFVKWYRNIFLLNCPYRSTINAAQLQCDVTYHSVFKPSKSVQGRVVQGVLLEFGREPSVYRSRFDSWHSSRYECHQLLLPFADRLIISFWIASGYVFYHSLSKIATNHGRRCICSVFRGWLIPSSAIDRKRALDWWKPTMAICNKTKYNDM